MLFSSKKTPVPEVILNGEKLPWVEKAQHLGNNLTISINLKTKGIRTTSDLLQKKSNLLSGSI